MQIQENKTTTRMRRNARPEQEAALKNNEAEDLREDDELDSEEASDEDEDEKEDDLDDSDLDDSDLDDDDDDEDSGDDDDDDDDDERANARHFVRGGFDRDEMRAPEAPTRAMPEDRQILEEAARDQLFVVPPEPPMPKRRGRPPGRAAAGPIASDARDRIEGMRLAQVEEVESRQKAIVEEFYDYASALDFGASQHRIAVTRLAPEYDDVSGKRIVGHLQTFSHVISPDEIQQKYGGGKYQLTLMGPKATGTGMVIKAKRVIEIAGDPLVADDPRLVSRRKSQQESAETKNTLELVKSIVDAKDRDANRAFEEARETKKLLLQTLANKNETSSSGLKDFLSALQATSMKDKETMLEERRLQEERARKEMEARLEERRLQEDRLRQEREERKQEIELLRLQHEKTMEMMRMENQRIIAELQARTSKEHESNREATERMLEMMRLEKSKEAESSREMMLFMQRMESEKNSQMMQNQQLLMQQMQSMESSKTQMLMEALKEAKTQKDDMSSMLEKLVAMKQAFGALTSEPDGREPYEKMLDKAGELAPGILAAVSAMRGGGGGAPAQQRVAPNSVAVVDLPEPPPQRALPPSNEARPKRRPTLPKRPAEEQKAVRQNPSEPPPAPQKEEQKEASEMPTEFIFPEKGTDVETSIKMLVQNIEVALNQDMDLDLFYKDVVKKFPMGVLALLKMTSADKCVEILEQMAPDDWMINTPAGNKYVRELHETLAD